MKRSLLCALVACVGSVALAPWAYAHVTVQPNEAIVGSFSRFVVRVPTERDVPTTKVKVDLPPLAFVSFEPKEGWKRTVEMVKLDEPIEAFGQEITESVGSVTWSGGSIGAGEFDEFGFSGLMPDAEETLEFKATQTYQGGEVVKWAGAPESEEPAALVTTYDLAVEEGQGQLAALAELRQAATGETGAEEDEEDAETPAAAPATADDDAEEEEEDDDDSDSGMLLGGAALAVSLLALLLSLRSRRS